jgi:hypothetical protein
MGRKELEALIAVLQSQLAEGADNVITGSWTIAFSREHNAFLFEKCEIGGYCEERPSVIDMNGTIVDRGGPLLGDRD